MTELAKWAQSLHDEPHHARCAIHGGGECDCYRTTRPEYPMAEEALALLSRLDTLEAERDEAQREADGWKRLTHSERVAAAEAQVEALKAERDGAVAQSEEDGLVMQNCHAGCLALEAKVEALRKALENVVVYCEATDPPVPLWATSLGAIAREALSRVSRSEPAPPTRTHEDRYMQEERGGLFSQAIGLARLALHDGDAERALRRLDEACAKANALHRAALVADGWPTEDIDRFLGAPPVPEEQT